MMMKNKIIFLIAVFALLYTASSAVCGEENHRADIPGHAEFIDEPVFNGYIYFVQSKNNFKTTVLLVHGIGDDASDIWRDLVPVLEKQYRVIYFDLPGFGRSAKGEGIYSPGKYDA
jgi:pimeloyl-ACP methyl ester carboxylesterase